MAAPMIASVISPRLATQPAQETFFQQRLLVKGALKSRLVLLARSSPLQ